MKIRTRFYYQHLETEYLGYEDKSIWLHLVYNSAISKKRIDAMLYAYQCIIYQHGMHAPICVQATKHLQKIRDEVDIEETEAGVWLADPIALAEYCTRNLVDEKKYYLVSESLYHRMSESFKPVGEVGFESLVQSVAKDEGMFYALIE